MTGGSARSGAAAQGPDAGHELGEGEGLGQVVVGAERQALDPVVDAARRGQHEDAGRERLAGQPPADLVAMDDGQVAVEHHDVVAVDGDPIEGGAAVVGDVDGHRLPAQATGDGVGQYLLVLDHQHSHLGSHGVPVRITVA